MATSICQHDTHEDCMFCSVCGICKENLNDDDICAECVGRKEYKFRTSLGTVFISFDPGKVKAGEQDRAALIEPTFLQGREHLDDLYAVESIYITRSNDESLWLNVGLTDPFYGDPEYLLEENVRE